MKYKYRFDKRYHRALINIRALGWHKPKDYEISWQNYKTIGVVYPHLIGDIVMATPFFRKLRQIAPQAKITFIGASWAKQFLNTQHLIDEFICYQNPLAMLGTKAMLKNWRDIGQTLKQARKQTFDVVIEPFGSTTALLFMSFLRAKHYVGVDFANLSKLQTFTVPYDPNGHLIDGLMRVFETTGHPVQPQERIPKIVLTEQQLKFGNAFIAEHHLQNKTIIGIHPGASVPSRRFSGFGQTINLLCKANPQITVCLFCGPGDDDFVQNILNQVEPDVQPRVLIVKRDMAQYMAILNICIHVICNDSSCGHISAALGRPVTVLFAQGDPRFIAPRGTNTVNIISKDFPCKPCLRNACPKHTYECFTWITPEIVLQTVKKQLPQENA